VKVDALVDTNIIVDLLQNRSDALRWYTDTQLYLAIMPIVWFETYEGVENKAVSFRTLRFLRQFHMEHSTVDDDLWAMKQYEAFYLSHGVEWSDCLIASVALRLNVPVFTGNLRHFNMLPGVTTLKPY
jgi:predicted nucleic acid-binding protein